MATLSTTSLNWLANEWEKQYKSAVLSGIVGDLAHKARGGYHISRQDQSSSNYSVTRPDDKLGPSDRASAIDMTMSTADIIKCHTRLREIWKNRAKDPRMKYVNAWNGWDGQGDAGRYDVIKGTIDSATPDHKWHIHLEIRRRYVNDMTAMKAILSMVKGESLATYQASLKPPAPAPKPVTPPKPVVTPPKPVVTPPKPVVTTPPKGTDMTKDEMLALLKSPEGKAAVANAVWNTDGVLGAPGNPVAGKNADGTDVNTHWTATSYTQSIYLASTASRDAAKAALARDFVDEAAIATALLGNTALLEALSAKVAEKVPTGVQVTPEDVTTALKAALREGVAS